MQNLYVLTLAPKFRPGMIGLSGFGHAHVLWWADQCASPGARQTQVCEKPYAKGPDRVGVFASRSPARPNPIAMSIVSILDVDPKAGKIYTPYMDAHPGTQVLDIKPYVPALDRVNDFTGPEWCRHWPSSYEASAEFDWDGEFTPL
ncbi:MAG: TrmO family methyltransferase [Desulfobacterales bacterium]|nr:TrmO family methyltransferase [Desulfobacterales bacterium]